MRLEARDGISFLNGARKPKIDAMRFTRSVAATVVLAALLFAGSARAIVLGQVDNFEDNTLQNWANGGARAFHPS